MNSSTEKNESCETCEFTQNLGILRQLYFFSKLPLETVKVFAYLCNKEIFKAGDLLFEQGEDDGQAFYLLSGMSRLIRELPEGPSAVRDLEPDAFIGTLALLGNARRLYSLQAVTDVTALVLTRDKISRALAQFPELMPKVMQTVVERIYGWEEQFLLRYADNDDACLKETGVSLI